MGILTRRRLEVLKARSQRPQLALGLPIVATEGDALAELIDAEGLGRTVPAGDVEAVVRALEHLLSDERAGRACRDNMVRVAPRFQWDRVLAPLVEFCRDPARAPDVAVPTKGEAARGLGEAARQVWRRLAR